MKTYIGFSYLPDPAFHRAYNEWHHLDHRPENLALPGLHWGERWVVSPDCAELVARSDDPRFARVDYVTTYWLREPLKESIDAFAKLGSDCFHWGRHPFLAQVERPLMSWADPVRGEAARRVAVSAEAVPIRPHRGVHLTVSRFRGSAPEVHDALQWYEFTSLPALVEGDGVAGVWTFVETDGPLGHAGFHQDPGPLRYRIAWLDADPVEWTRTHADQLANPDFLASGREQVLFSSPLRAILPFQYDWFD